MLRRLSLILMLLGAPAAASSPDAWAVNGRAAATACMRASGFRAATVAQSRAGFPDTIGYDALLVRGTWPQKHMKGAKGTMLCLWHRASRRAAVSEATGWSAR